MPLATGARLGPYEILSAIGAGGMGEVYRARDTRLKRDVAIKILPSSVAADRERVARFEREAELLAALNHPHIAHIHGVEESGGSLALVMELVEGETLADRIAYGAIAVDEALPLAGQIADALEAAHERGIVHRDLKPANIKVRPDGTVKVLDFGLAKAMDMAGGAGATGEDLTHSPTITSPAMTQAGMILGTAAYMSPEQARGKPVDRRADIWAFGCVVFEMLTGSRAFGGDDVSDVLASVLAREPDWSRLPANLSPVFAQYLKRCLQKDPRRRIRDIGDVLLALDGAFDAPVSALAPAINARPLWTRLIPIAAAALVAAAATGVVMWNRRPVAAPSPVSRFDVILPSGQELRGAQRSVIAVAPDGRAFVYKASDGLYLRSMGDLEPRLIPGTADRTGSTLASPFFSPDGQWIGYFGDTGLTKIGVTGGAPITIAAAALSYGASWTADNTILFGQPAGIMRVSANGGTPEVVVRAEGGEQLWQPQLLPGGDAVLFSVLMPGGRGTINDGDIAVHSLSTGARSVIVRGASAARYLPNGHIVYGVRNTLMAIPFDARRLTTTGGAAPIVQAVQRPVGVNAGGFQYAVSDSGTLVYLADNTPNRSLRWVNRDGTSGGTVDAVPAGALEDPRLSANGDRVLVTRDGDIWIYDLASGRSTRVTKDGHSQMAVWDPTGTQVAYSSLNGSPTMEAWVAPADGSAPPRQLTHDGGPVHVDSWSPDGHIVSVHRHSLANVTIRMIPVDRPNQQPVVFADGELQPESVAFAKDGRYVVYLSTDSGAREIYIRPYPGPGGRNTISVNGGVEPRWAANGEVFYRNPTGDRLFSVSTRTTPTFTAGKPTLLFQGQYYVAPTGSPRAQYDVTADGKRFLMLAAVASTDIAGGRPRFVVVQNWLDELKRPSPQP
jgi:eukaryotic-like serine/threonine-protein kinase